MSGHSYSYPLDEWTLLSTLLSTRWVDTLINTLIHSNTPIHSQLLHEHFYSCFCPFVSLRPHILNISSLFVLFCFCVVFWTVVAVQRPSRWLHCRRLFFFFKSAHQFFYLSALLIPWSLIHTAPFFDTITPSYRQIFAFRMIGPKNQSINSRCRVRLVQAEVLTWVVVHEVRPIARHLIVLYLIPIIQYFFIHSLCLPLCLCHRLTSFLLFTFTSIGGRNNHVFHILYVNNEWYLHFFHDAKVSLLLHLSKNSYYYNIQKFTCLDYLFIWAEFQSTRFLISMMILIYIYDDTCLYLWWYLLISMMILVFTHFLLQLCHQDIFFRARCASLNIHPTRLIVVCFFVLFHSCCFHAEVFGKTLVQEFHFSCSMDTEWNLLSSLSENGG